MTAALEDVSEKTELAGKQLFIHGKPDRSDLLGVIRALLYSDPGFVEAGIGFMPFSYDPQIRLYGFSYSVDENGIHFHDLDSKQDYTKVGARWYNGAMKGTPVWLEPQYDEKRHEMIVTYAMPLFDPQYPTKPTGVIFATYAVGRLQGVLDAMDLGANGYAFLLSSTEHFLLHPNSDYIQNRRTLGDVRGYMITNQAAAAETLDDALRDPSHTMRFEDAYTGMDSQVFFSHPILPAAWTLGVVLVDQDLQMPPAAVQAKQIRFALLFALAVVILIVPLSGALQGSIVGLWVLSLVFSVSCIFVYGFALWLAMHQPAAEGPGLLRITNRNVLNKFISEQRHRTLAQRQEMPLFIPAGIYIQSMAFENASDVGITGYVWQRYTDGVDDHVVRGFEMAETESFNRQEPHTIQSGNLELVRWSFKATLPQQLDYSRYPIGRQNVSIRLWHKQFTENIILIPDLDSYTLLNPAAKPGMLRGLTLGGWTIKGSSFDYRFEKYQTSFGLTDSAGLTDYPELYFNITIEKAITGPMIANILPLVVIFILLSTILYLSSRLEAQVTVITACASFFLIVVFSHIGLRHSLATDTIVYLEYFYFTTYVMILYVTLNYIFWTSAEAEIAQSSNSDAPRISPLSRVIFYRNNLIPKLLFWPASQLALLVLTLLTFD